ncbi:MAG TPA: hypothetical protein VGH16_18135 [Candidatus Binatia bacterium]
MPGYEEGKRQADIERETVESRNGLAEPEVVTPTPRVAVTSEGFDGMNFNDTAGFVPPDTHAATGPSHIVEVVNTSIAIYNRTTGAVVLGPTDLTTFFNSVGASDNLTDPIVAYDEQMQRFFIGIIDFGANNTISHLLYAVSDDSAPTSVASFSKKYSIAIEEPAKVCGGTVFADFTRYGWNADAHVFAYNMFNASGNCFDHVSVITIDKSSIDTPTLVFTHSDRSGLGDFTLTPTVMHGSSTGGPMWFVEAVISNQIRVVKMTNVLAATPTFAEFDIPVASYSFSVPSATQKGGGRTIDTGDGRILNVEWRGNRLVATHNIGVSGAARARWYEFNTSGISPTLTQQGTLNPGTGIHNYYPSIAIAANGDLGMTFMQSSSNEFMSMYVTGQRSGDPPGTMQTPILAKAGERNYNSTVPGDCPSNGNPCRAGDYSGVTADPDLSDAFCAANEYATSDASENWGTWIACFTLQPDVVPHDLAVSAVKASKTAKNGVPSSVTVTIQNRSPHVETITSGDLGDGSSSGLVRLGFAATDDDSEICTPTVALNNAKNAKLFSSGSKTLAVGKTMAVSFLVTYTCASPMSIKGDSTPNDFSLTATVHHEELAGGEADSHPADDVCPRGALGFDPNPAPKGTTDKGCGGKGGGPIVVNVVP